MRYPLIFPHDEEEWHPFIPLTGINLTDNAHLHACRRTRVNSESENDNDNDMQDTTRHGRGGSKRVSQSQYYAFQLQKRNGIFSPLLHAGRLCQEYCVDAWVCVESNRLQWVRTHQPELRAECYNGLQDTIGTGVEEDAQRLGHRIILSASIMACENCGAPLPLSTFEQELPPLPSLRATSRTAMQTQSPLMQQPEVASETTALYDEHDPSSATVPLLPSNVPPEQVRSLILRAAPSSSHRRQYRERATRGQHPHSSNLPVLSSETALYSSPSMVSIDTPVTDHSARPSDVFAHLPRKYPFWFPRRPPDIIGSIIHIQEHSENSSMTWSFLRGLCDIVWVAQSSPNAHAKHEQLHVTMLRLRLSDGTQKDARLEGYLMGAHLTLGDVLSLWGRQRRRVIIVRRAFNNTSGAVVSTRLGRYSVWPSLVFLVVLLLILFVVYHWYTIPVLPDLTQWLKY